MKTKNKMIIVPGFLAIFIMLSSFFSPKGGDAFEIYLNGKRLLQQFVHVDKSVKTLQLTSASVNDKLDIFYTHCGRTGKSRVITVRNEKDKDLKSWKFPDASGSSGMTIFLKDLYALEKTDHARFTIVYSSKELPEGKSLASLTLGNANFARK